MAYYGGFQNNGFQNNAYQILKSGAGNNWLGGVKFSDERSRIIHRHRAKIIAEERKQNEIALRAKEQEIQRIEQMRLKALDDERLQAELMAAFVQFNYLEFERRRLEAIWLNIMREEEEIFVILMSLPFVS